MINWWNELSFFQQIYAMFAIPATLILVLQTLLMLIGVGGHSDADSDLGMDSEHFDVGEHSDMHMPSNTSGLSGLKLFTVRGVIAFFTVTGWSGIVFADVGLSSAMCIVLSTICGFASLVLISLLFKNMIKLQSSGNLDFANAVGQMAQVYISIPGNKSGSGKVFLTVQNRYIEAEAMTGDPDGFKQGQTVRVSGLFGENTLLVDPIGEKTEA